MLLIKVELGAEVSQMLGLRFLGGLLLLLFVSLQIFTDQRSSCTGKLELKQREVDALSHKLEPLSSRVRNLEVELRTLRVSSIRATEHHRKRADAAVRNAASRAAELSVARAAHTAEKAAAASATQSVEAVADAAAAAKKAALAQRGRAKPTVEAVVAAEPAVAAAAPTVGGGSAAAVGGSSTLDEAVLAPGLSYGVELEFCYTPADSTVLQQLRRDKHLGDEKAIPVRKLVLAEAAERLKAATGLTFTTQYESSCKEDSKGWRIVMDVSVWNYGYCTGTESDIEIVSPPLRNQADIDTLRSVLKALRGIRVRATRGCGLHIHVGAGHFSLPQLRVVTQQLYKYERALDLLVPKSRRIAGNDNQFIFSNRGNKHWGKRGGHTNAQLNGALAHASKLQLVQWTNPNYSARFVLSLRRMVRDDCKRPIKPAAQTIEFRQQVATADDTEILSWMQLLATFLRQAATLPPPKSAPDNMKAPALLQDMLANLLQDPHFLQKNNGAVMALADRGEAHEFK